MGSLRRFLWLFSLLLFIVVLPLSTFSPFVFEYEFTKFIIFYFFGAILLFFTGVFVVKNENVELPKREIFFLLLIFLILYLVASIFSINPLISLIGYFGSFTGGLIYVLFLGVIFYSSFILRNERKLILQTVFLSGLLVSVYGVWQYANNYLATHQLIFRIYSTIGQPNRLAFFLLAVLPISFYLFWEEKKNLLKTVYGLGLMMILLAFFLTFSRSAYAVLFIVFLGMAFGLIRHHSLRSFAMTTKVVFLFTVVCFLLFGYFFARSIPSTITNFSQSSSSLRLAEWQGSVNAIVNRPLWRQLIGYGPETVYFTFFKYRPAVYNQSLEEFNVGPNQVRNFYLHLLSTIGLLGLLAYLFLYKKILQISWKNGQNDPFAKGIFFSFLGIGLYSLFYYQTDTVLPLFWILAGIIMSNENNHLHYINIYYYSEKIIGVLFVFITVILLYGLGRASLAHFYASSIPTEQNYVMAVKLNPFFDVYGRNLSLLYMNEMLGVKNTDKKQSLEKYLLSKKAISEALSLSPLDIRNVRQMVLINYYAGVNLDKNYQKENTSWAKKLVEMSPSDYRSWDFLGLVYLDISDLQTAQKYFEKELTLKNDFPGVYLHLGEVAKQEGKIDTAIDYYKKAVSLSPGWDFSQNELKKALELKKNLNKNQ